MAEQTVQTIHPNHGSVVRVLQVTDSHIFAENEGRLLGLDTRKSFAAVKARIDQEEVAPDLLLATGDLAQDASTNAYEFLRDQLNTLNYPSYWIPGNHDCPETMRQVLDHGKVSPCKHILSGDWQIVLLDTAVPNKVHGELSDGELAFLSDAILSNPDKHLLVVMHHQPVDVGSEWLDKLGLHNADALFDCVAKCNNRVCFLWGHVHQDFVSEVRGIQLIATPSTCVQFAEDSEEFKAGQESPGYRYLHLHPDGRVESVLHRVESIEYTVDYSVKGY